MSDFKQFWLTPAASAFSSENASCSTLSTAINSPIEDSSYQFWSDSTLLRGIEWYHARFQQDFEALPEELALEIASLLNKNTCFDRDSMLSIVKRLIAYETEGGFVKKSPLSLLFRGILAFGNYEIISDLDIRHLGRGHGIFMELPREVKIYRILCIQRDILDETVFDFDSVDGINIQSFLLKSMNEDIEKIMPSAIKSNCNKRVQIAKRELKRRRNKVELYVGDYQNGYNLLLLKRTEMAGYLPLSEDKKNEPLLSRSFILSESKVLRKGYTRDMKDEIRYAASFLSDIKNLSYLEAVTYITKTVEYYKQNPYTYSEEIITPKFTVEKLKRLYQSNDGEEEKFVESLKYFNSDIDIDYTNGDIYFRVDIDNLFDDKLFNILTEYGNSFAQVDDNGFLKESSFVRRDREVTFELHSAPIGEKEKQISKDRNIQILFRALNEIADYQMFQYDERGESYKYSLSMTFSDIVDRYNETTDNFQDDFNSYVARSLPEVPPSYSEAIYKTFTQTLPSASLKHDKESRFKLFQLKRLYEKHSVGILGDFDKSFNKLLKENIIRVDEDNIWWFSKLDSLKDIFDTVIDRLDQGVDIDSNGYVVQLEEVNIESLHPFFSRYRMDEDENDGPMLNAFDDLLGYQTEFATGILGLKFSDIEELYNENPMHSKKFIEELTEILPLQGRDAVIKTLRRNLASDETDESSPLRYRTLYQLYKKHDKNGGDFDKALNILKSSGLIVQKGESLLFGFEISDLFRDAISKTSRKNKDLTTNPRGQLRGLLKLKIDKNYMFTITDILKNGDAGDYLPLLAAFRDIFQYDESDDTSSTLSMKFADIERLFDQCPEKSFKEEFIFVMNDIFKSETVAIAIYNTLKM